jgi:flavin-dependent dehydrogenase
MTDPEPLDAIVIGAGPAGATAAAVLAKRGRRVLLLERETFPRYHVGESLLPYSWWTLDRLGVLEQVAAAGFQAKYSVRFASASGRMSKPFTFTDHIEHDAARTWQVERSKFDQILVEHARAMGADVKFGTRVTGLIERDGQVIGVTAIGPDGEHTYRALVTIDASGRDGLSRRKRAWHIPEPRLNRLAYWTYYDGVTHEEGIHRGSTTIVQLPDDGWCWFFPMGDGRTSVGVVARHDVLFRNTRDPDTVWEEQMAANPWLAEQLAGSVRHEELWITSDFSYRSEYCADDGLVLVGDAFAFLDPVFSSGVFLALRTGEEAAIAVDAALTTGNVDASAFEAYGEWACAGIEAMRALVFSFYDPDFSMGRLMRSRPDLRGDVTDLLIGNIFRDYDKLFRALAEHGHLPDALNHGRAKVSVA